jgi:glutathione synthase/RimK-type ligase-like ATP-grasp enzyme
LYRGFRSPLLEALGGKLILVVTNANDEHADLFCEYLASIKSLFVRFNTELFPSAVSASFSFARTELAVASLLLPSPHGEVLLKDITSVWYRRPEPGIVSQALSCADQEFVTHEVAHVLASMWRLLESSFWVNPIACNRSASFKPYQLEKAQRAGLQIPRTLMSNNREQILAFAESCSSGLLYKPFNFHTERQPDGYSRTIYANKVSIDYVRENSHALSIAPCIFQEYIEKCVELRVTVVGRTLFTCQIDSQRSQVSNIDWRRYDFSQMLYASSSLPDHVVQKILRLMDALGLVFGCIDLILTPTGEYVFLEINPNGQWYWVEKLTSLPIAEHLARLLITRVQ